MDLSRPTCALALTRLHAKAQPLDLDGALGHEPLRDAGCEGAERTPIRVAEASVLARGDHQSAALTLEAERLDQHRTCFEPEFVQPGRFLAAGPLQRKRLACHVERPKRTALHRQYAHAHRHATAGGGDTQLTALLDHHQQRRGVEQRKAAIGHQAQQPQLRPREHGVGLWT